MNFFAVIFLQQIFLCPSNPTATKKIVHKKGVESSIVVFCKENKTKSWYYYFSYKFNQIEKEKQNINIFLWDWIRMKKKSFPIAMEREWDKGEGKKLWAIWHWIFISCWLMLWFHYNMANFYPPNKTKQNKNIFKKNDQYHIRPVILWPGFFFGIFFLYIYEAFIIKSINYNDFKSNPYFMIIVVAIIIRWNHNQN